MKVFKSLVQNYYNTKNADERKLRKIDLLIKKALFSLFAEKDAKRQFRKLKKEVKANSVGLVGYIDGILTKLDRNSKSLRDAIYFKIQRFNRLILEEMRLKDKDLYIETKKFFTNRGWLNVAWTFCFVIELLEEKGKLHEYLPVQDTYLKKMFAVLQKEEMFFDENGWLIEEAMNSEMNIIDNT